MIYSLPHNKPVDMSELKTFADDNLELLNPFPNKPWILCVYSTSLLKTLWEKINCS